MFDNLFGTEAGPVVNYIFAFGIVIALIILIAWVARRFLSRGDFHFGPRTGQRRLAVVEAAGVDGQRRLILVRRDEVEHLLLIGGAADIVVEANIGKDDRKEARPQPVAGLATPPAPPVQRPRPPVTAQPTPANTQAQPQPRPAMPPRPSMPPAMADDRPRPPMPPRSPLASQVPPQPQEAPRRYSFETPAEREMGRFDRETDPVRSPGERGGDE